MDHVVTNNIDKNKDQRNDGIENELMFDNIFNLSISTKYPLPVITVIPRGGNKHISNTVAVLECLWDRGANNSMIKIRHTKYYERKMRYNKL